MLPQQDERKLIQRYLLCQLTEEAEWRQVEERLLSDAAFQDEIDLAEADLIDEYVFETLTPDETAAFERTILTHPQRRAQVLLARALRQYALDEEPETAPAPAVAVPDKPPPARRWAWREWFSLPAVRVAVLAAVLVAVGVGIWRVFIYQSGVDQGLAQLRRAYPQDGPLDVRLTGLDYAPPPPATRGSNTAQPDAIALRLAENKLLEAIQATPGAAATRALGLFYLTQKRYDEAVKQLEAALKLAPDNAQLHADLGAALLAQGLPLYERDRAQGRPNPAAQPKQLWLELFSRSLTHLARALELDANLLPARFNRALCLQSMTLANQAREAWQEYLARDANSPWAERARAYLKQLDDAQAAAQTPEQILAGFLDAHRQRDDARAWQILSQTREMITGRMVVFQLARKFLETSTQNRPDEARNYLDAFTYAGELEKQRGSDPYVSELARYYSTTDDRQKTLLSNAQAKIDQGYAQCLNAKYDAALGSFKDAQNLFNKAGNIGESHMANYWIAYCYSQATKMDEAVSRVATTAQWCRAKTYKWLASQALFWVGDSYHLSNEFSKSLVYQHEALKLAQEISDSYNEQKIGAGIGALYTKLGQPERALHYHQASLAAAGLNPALVRQAWRNYTLASGTFYKLNDYYASAAFEKEALYLSLEKMKDPMAPYSSHLHLTAIYAALGQYDEAQKQAHLSLQRAQMLKEESVSQQMEARAEAGFGHLWRNQGDCASALPHYERATQIYNHLKEFWLEKYEAHKGKLMCYLRGQDDSATQTELTYLLDFFENNRKQIIEGQNRDSFFSNEQSVYDLAIAYYHAKNNDTEAFSYAEDRARSLLDAVQQGVTVGETSGNLDSTLSSAARPLGLAEIRARMPPQVQIIQYSALPDKLLIWFITPNRFEVVEKDITQDKLKTQVTDYLASVKASATGNTMLLAQVQQQATALYEILLRPVAAWLDKSQMLCLIPDKSLAYLPFASLIEPLSGRYLVSDFAVFAAPSASALVLFSERAQHHRAIGAERLLAVGNPAFDRHAYPDLPNLPAASQETQEITRNYRNYLLLNGSQAQADRVQAEMVKANVIHLACHYVVDDASPLRSKLLLASNDKSDGTLPVYEVLRLNLHNASLVTLSACQTDMEHNREGLAGLSRAFLAAGVPLVVASQWAVESEATAALMTKFHRYRTQGLATIAALRQAQQDMLNGDNERYRRPFYWAAFLPVGGYANF